ncbi:MAG: hypothetical protein CMJ21_02815 [Phycisphaerae bacterium]|nr:hypothetical protein [Phycisphaerae bacterium]MDP6152739.1 hypothetical protein [Phycisphaeraceae bacterium]
MKLIGFKPQYRNKAPKSLAAIAHRVVEHCVEFLALDVCPQMVLEDSTTEDSINLKSLFSDHLRTKRDKFNVSGHEFSIMHVMAHPRPGEKHSIYLLR